MSVLILTGAGATGKDYVAAALKQKWGEKVVVSTSPTRAASLEYGIKTERQGAALKGEELQKFQFFLFDAYNNHLRSFLRVANMREQRNFLHILVRAPIDYNAYCKAVIDPLVMNYSGLEFRTVKGMTLIRNCKTHLEVVGTPWPPPWYGKTEHDAYRKTDKTKDSNWAMEHAHLFRRLSASYQVPDTQVSEFRSFDLEDRLAHIERLFPEVLFNAPTTANDTPSEG
jgi:hypothetical protein